MLSEKSERTAEVRTGSGSDRVRDAATAELGFDPLHTSRSSFLTRRRNDFLENFLVDIRKSFHVQASFPGLVLAELL